jgi:hypothetical protein
MRKDAKKLNLDRDTLRRLDAALTASEIRNARGGIVSSDNQDCTYSRIRETTAPVLN